MRRLATVLLAAMLPVVLVAATAPPEPPEGVNHMIEVSIEKTGQVTAAGGTGGTNLLSDPACDSASYTATCEKTLVKFLDKGHAVATVTPAYPSDYDLHVYTSDKTGMLGEEVALSENPYTPVAPGEQAEWDVKLNEYYLVIVMYVVGGGGYSMTVGVD